MTAVKDMYRKSSQDMRKAMNEYRGLMNILREDLYKLGEGVIKWITI